MMDQPNCFNAQLCTVYTSKKTYSRTRAGLIEKFAAAAATRPQVKHSAPRALQRAISSQPHFSALVQNKPLVNLEYTCQLYIYTFDNLFLQSRESEEDCTSGNYIAASKSE